MKKRNLIAGLAVVAVSFTAGAGSAAGWWDKPKPPHPGTVVPALPAGQSNPMIATGVGIGANTPYYKTSGLGPSALNTGAPAGSEASYIDTTVFPSGVLPAGVTITEAQGINVLRRIGENLQAAGLSYDDVYTMRVFLQNPAGAATADFAGWNRAYRQYFANTDLTTGQYIPVPLGTAAPTKPFVVNKARPSRFALEIENLPVNGWLVEVEVDAAYPAR
ncbi:enamine deaminase RidA (YjgF/YER057c/UK114 family) [Kribbella sp. VKM Ac-2527]|uniref:Enamine deaminase RidA (YjgF/YER057c/UK114 family) n=1 Tax=Kribbella caucasensis TaxID=2512215 RepID=A0A4R6KHZ9_9ACTN|nr:Rid family hydrolase [Kribbella sp. VKM Ac-2527]TDO50663.1 enamine deaminase RidA (YjgF/YER057c/UK114 family) [Kribbella sp. VKM Ac-2527]